MSLSFLKDSETEETLPTWKILIVDDEEDIHTVTKMALKRFEFDNKKLTFLHAYSAMQARDILAQEEDIALTFLDVVMETDDAGLLLAKWIRQELKNKFIRIVLRTGQPGQAPEEQVIVDYDINDYKEKTELDRKKLFTTVYTSLRAYRDIIDIEEARKYQEMYRSGLERVIDSTTKVLDKHTLQNFFGGLLQQVMSILKIDRNSMLLQLSGMGLIYSENDFEVIAQIQAPSSTNSIDEEAIGYLNKAISKKCTIIEDNVLVGYFPSSTDKISLLYLKGVECLSQIDIQLLEIFSGNVSLAFDNLLLNNEIVETQEELICKLGDAVESRSKESGNHIKRMSEVSYVLAKALKLPKDECDLLRQAAPMHDIGKIATPDSILLKPGPLTDEEMEIMKQHAEIGYNILAGSKRPILNAAAIISRQHHEKFDGSGYPLGLKGDEIHIFARIVAVADVFDALTHKRCYKDAWPMKEVLGYLNESKGKHLDPKIVELLIENIEKVTDINQQFTD
ncbi:HD domain-containing phosphohydrolase [Thalassotalea ganghwensis]